VTGWLSFRLQDEFVNQYRDKRPDWGFPIGAGNSLGEQSWVSKYARRKEDGTRERFYEGLRRVTEGFYSIQYDHAIHNRLPWSNDIAQASAQEAYTLAFAGKWSPPGRGLWMCGTEMVNGKRDGSALYNCSFISTSQIAGMDDPSLPFARLMTESMLGIGVGFDTLGAGKLTLHEPEGCVPHLIADSREGWAESVANLLRAFLLPNRRLPVFDYSKVRPAGSPIHGFGGVASGPAPLVKVHAQLIALLGKRGGQVLTSTDIVDVNNMLGKCVVSANVRRSAEIALGLPDDEDFLDLKDYRKNPVRNGLDGYGHLSNNSVIAQSGGDYSHLVPRIILNGEPGIFWLDIVRDYGRLADPPDHKEYRTMGSNPCGEIPLESFEKCNLVETFPTRCDSLQDYLRVLKFAFLFSKSVTLLPVQWGESNEVMTRNRRIGVSMTGVSQFAESHGWAELRRWQDAGYKEIRKWDKVYSEWLGVRESIRVSTVKPSGTVSLLWGVTPGVHWPRESGYYVRTIREMKDSPFAKAMEDAGYKIEPSVSDPDSTVVIYLPVEGPEMRAEHQVSAWEKVALAAQAQKFWSDNSVSCTVTFSEDEAKEIPAILRAYDGQLKSISFLPMAEGTYEQAPYQRVSRDTWTKLRENVKPIDWDALYGSPDLPEAEGEMYCANDVCEVPR